MMNWTYVRNLLQEVTTQYPPAQGWAHRIELGVDENELYPLLTLTLPPKDPRESAIEAGIEMQVRQPQIILEDGDTTETLLAFIAANYA